MVVILTHALIDLTLSLGSILMCGSYSACVVKSIHYSVVNLQFNSLSGVLSQMILMQTDCQDVS